MENTPAKSIGAQLKIIISLVLLKDEPLWVNKLFWKIFYLLNKCNRSPFITWFPRSMFHLLRKLCTDLDSLETFPQHTAHSTISPPQDPRYHQVLKLRLTILVAILSCTAKLILTKGNLLHLENPKVISLK